jgi:hypothetical protein
MDPKLMELMNASVSGKIQKREPGKITKCSVSSVSLNYSFQPRRK